MYIRFRFCTMALTHTIQIKLNQLANDSAVKLEVTASVKASVGKELGELRRKVDTLQTVNAALVLAGCVYLFLHR